MGSKHLPCECIFILICIFCSQISMSVLVDHVKMVAPAQMKSMDISVLVHQAGQDRTATLVRRNTAMYKHFVTHITN